VLSKLDILTFVLNIEGKMKWHDCSIIATMQKYILWKLLNQSCAISLAAM